MQTRNIALAATASALLVLAGCSATNVRDIDAKLQQSQALLAQYETVQTNILADIEKLRTLLNENPTGPLTDQIQTAIDEGLARVAQIQTYIATVSTTIDSLEAALDSEDGTWDPDAVASAITAASATLPPPFNTYGLLGAGAITILGGLFGRERYKRKQTESGAESIVHSIERVKGEYDWDESIKNLLARTQNDQAKRLVRQVKGE